MTTAFTAAIRPEKQDRLQMIRVFVDGIQKVCLNPTCNQCAVIAKAIVQKHPDSFLDTKVSLCNNKKRVENINRTNTVARLQRKTCTNTKES
ncbi:hypothetical protein J4Q44_G00011230 [Coregonus suidteri]|uniref:Uncharacterized protein n=1 Tax=Coregonus suidteri TaxID=861788 RepID=A0AAN8MDV8_9TELE